MFHNDDELNFARGIKIDALGLIIGIFQQMRQYSSTTGVSRFERSCLKIRITSYWYEAKEVTLALNLSLISCDVNL
jgi:hypothetical protein